MFELVGDILPQRRQATFISIARNNMDTIGIIIKSYEAVMSNRRTSL